MRQRMGSLFNPGLKKLTRAASTFSKKATEFKESAKKSFQPEDKLKNPTKDFLKKGEKLISYDYTNKGDNPDHIDNNRFFASRFNLQNRVYYEEENGVKEKPN